MDSAPPASESRSAPEGTPAAPPSRARLRGAPGGCSQSHAGGLPADRGGSPHPPESACRFARGIALVGSIATLGAFLTLVYPVVFLAWITFHSVLSRFLTQLFVAGQTAHGRAAVLPLTGSGRKYFTVSPLDLRAGAPGGRFRLDLLHRSGGPLHHGHGRLLGRPRRRDLPRDRRRSRPSLRTRRRGPSGPESSASSRWTPSCPGNGRTQERPRWSGDDEPGSGVRSRRRRSSAALRVRGHFFRSSRDIARSANRRPPVWQVAQ